MTVVQQEDPMTVVEWPNPISPGLSPFRLAVPERWSAVAPDEALIAFLAPPADATPPTSDTLPTGDAPPAEAARAVVPDPRAAAEPDSRTPVSAVPAAGPTTWRNR